jgi:hypothetical protein
MTGAVISSLAIKRAHPLNLREETLPSAAPASRRRRFDGARERLNCPGDLAAAVGRGLCGGGDRRFIPQPRMGVNMIAAAPPAWDQLDGETLREEFALRGIALFFRRPTDRTLALEGGVVESVERRAFLSLRMARRGGAGLRRVRIDQGGADAPVRVGRALCRDGRHRRPNATDDRRHRG